MKRLIFVGALVLSAAVSQGEARAAGHGSLTMRSDTKAMTAEESAQVDRLAQRIDKIAMPKGIVSHGRSTPGTLVSAAVSSAYDVSKSETIAALQRIVDRHDRNPATMLTKVAEHLEQWTAHENAALSITRVNALRRQFGAEMAGMRDPGIGWEHFQPPAQKAQGYRAVAKPASNGLKALEQRTEAATSAHPSSPAQQRAARMSTAARSPSVVQRIANFGRR